jgi:AcrR family transcriptional regulator
VPLLPKLPLLDHIPPDAAVRTRILAAGVDLLHTEGFNALTQPAVAARAGVRQSHITYYFPTRTALLSNIAQYGCKEMFESIVEKGAQGKLTAKEFREFLLPTELDRGWLRLMSGLHAVCDEDPSIAAWIDEFDGNVMAQFHTAFCAIFGEIPMRTVEALHACFVGVMMFESREQSPASLARARRTMAHALDLAIESAKAPITLKDKK